MINDKLLENRIVFLNGEVNDDSAQDVITKLLYLDSVNHNEISLYINSPGGSIIQGLAIIDCMHIIKSKVATYCVGEAYSMGSIILSCGAKGKRYILENSEVMIHAPSGHAYGKSSEVTLSAKRLDKFKDKLIDILVNNSKRSKQQIIKYFNYDKFMDAKETLEFGLVDKIIKSS